jgi:hypothetical protein
MSVTLDRNAWIKWGRALLDEDPGDVDNPLVQKKIRSSARTFLSQLTSHSCREAKLIAEAFDLKLPKRFLGKI